MSTAAGWPDETISPLASTAIIDYPVTMAWDQSFLTLFDVCCARFRAGNTDFNTYYNACDLAYLASIGHQPREFFDFVEDHCDEGTPPPSTALLVAAVRRDYFLTVQNGKASQQPRVTRDNIPTFGDELHGLPYLPRILAKARAKLRGELDPDLMFGCGGDRHFLHKNGDIHPADFLRRVWAAGDDTGKLADWIKSHRA